MSEASRNAPCPCGSGKKYKLCCVATSREAVPSPLAAVPLVAFTKSERHRAFAKVVAYAQRICGDAKLTRLMVDFAGNRGEAEAWDDNARFDFLAWLVYDHPHGRSTLCEQLLESRDNGLTPGERRYLQRMRESSMGVYEVEAIRLDEGLRLRDVRTGARIEVSERKATRHLAVFDVIAGRLMIGPQGATELDGASYVFQRHGLTPLVTEIEAAQTKAAVASAIHRFYVRETASPTLPLVSTVEGGEIAPSRVVFAAPPEALEKLRADARFEDNGDETLTWKQSARSSRIFGSVSVEHDRLVVETMSLERAEKARRLIEKILGPSARFERLETSSLVEAMAWHREKSGGETSSHEADDAVPDDVKVRVVDAFYKKHYGGWIDESLPALDGRTPREATKLPNMRRRVEALLEHIEAGLARQRAAGETTYDASWMREALWPASPAAARRSNRGASGANGRSGRR